ncbi:ribonuclease P protein subunit p21-like [Planoprotostelium fungivorum]|uniref:Ribonuclease P protein subunit p21-like n=1 Tax=Planoprotostelium fungivorum TaxID=1890364 RepID=A0A2P6NV30_9EUKA|nr:ribonuclease P protein subunit p21-like [Planoprotostelium fungivorum]
MDGQKQGPPIQKYKQKQQQKGKGRNGAPPLRNIETFERMNFLYQAAHLTAGVSPQLSRFYSSTVKKISTKTVSRLSPEIKRTICKICTSLLIPGYSSTVRIQGQKQRHLSVTCDYCGKIKRFRHEKKEKKKIEPTSGTSS